MTSVIRKPGLLALHDGRFLVCRKRGLADWILPGGKYEAGETAEKCLQRELQEELGTGARNLAFIGEYCDEAAGQPGRTVCIELYSGDLTGEPVPQAEIEAAHWFGRGDDEAALSPVLRRRILPDLRARGLIKWF